MLTSAKSVSQGNVYSTRNDSLDSAVLLKQFIIKDVCALYLSLSSELPVIQGER